MRISDFYWHLVINNGNFILLLTSSGPAWQFLISIDISLSTMAILYCNLQVFLSVIGDIFVTLKANAKKIVTLKCIWHQICTKMLLWRQMLRKSSLKNAFDVKFVQNVTLKANAQKIITLKCIWHQICTKSLI